MGRPAVLADSRAAPPVTDARPGDCRAIGHRRRPPPSGPIDRAAVAVHSSGADRVEIGPLALMAHAETRATTTALADLRAGRLVASLQLVFRPPRRFTM